MLRIRVDKSVDKLKIQWNKFIKADDRSIPSPYHKSTIKRQHIIKGKALLTFFGGRRKVLISFIFSNNPLVLHCFNKREKHTTSRKFIAAFVNIAVICSIFIIESSCLSNFWFLAIYRNYFL